MLLIIPYRRNIPNLPIILRTLQVILLFLVLDPPVWFWQFSASSVVCIPHAQSDMRIYKKLALQGSLIGLIVLVAMVQI